MDRPAMNDRKVLVTAGASGIGRTIALTFLEAGYHVTVCDIDESALANLAEEAPGIKPAVTDVSDPDAVNTLFATIAQAPGRFDVLVNNAGIAGPTAPVQDIEPSAWRQTLAVNLDGAFHCTRAAVPLLEAEGGSIVNIASNAALFGFPNRLPYTVSKWGLIGFTKTLAMELGPFGVRVNALCPGSVAGPRIEGVIERDAGERGLSAEAVRQEYTRQSSMRCFVDAEDIAAMAVFLASDAGAKISGQAIAIDGHTEGLFQISSEPPPHEEPT